MADKAMIDVIEQWLPHLGASPEQAPWIAERVAHQMGGLPAPLRLGVGTLQKALNILPEGSAPRLAGLPGTGEYVRLVRSLATVVYFAEVEATDEG